MPVSGVPLDIKKSPDGRQPQLHGPARKLVFWFGLTASTWNSGAVAPNDMRTDRIAVPLLRA